MTGGGCGGREGEMGGGSGRTYGKGRRGQRWQWDDPICCSSVLCDLIGKFVWWDVSGMSIIIH